MTERETKLESELLETRKRLVEAESLAERLKQEAQIHAQEARGANATIAEIYQVVSEGRGEPGNWHGSEPVKLAFESLRAALVEAQAEAQFHRIGSEVIRDQEAEIERLRRYLGTFVMNCLQEHFDGARDLATQIRIEIADDGFPIAAPLSQQVSQKEVV